jgi:4-amino-4-deoxy-L-arabinose transferase-like glycosyltransferase
MLKKLRLNNTTCGAFKGYAAVFLILAAAYFSYSYNLTGWLIHDDEGGYLYHAWRMSDGQTPYKDFYSAKEPLFLYTGYLAFKLFSPDIYWVRLLTVIVTILTGYLIFLIGRRIYSSKVGLWASSLYLILPVVYHQARRYRPDSYAVFFSTLALFLFIKAWQDNKKLLFACSGFFCAVALGYKLSALIGISALTAFIFYQAAAERRPSAVMRSFLPFAGGIILLLAGLAVLLNTTAPAMWACLVRHELTQPPLLPAKIADTVMESLKEFLMISPRQHGWRDGHPWLIIFSLPAAMSYLFAGRDIRKILTF